MTILDAKGLRMGQLSLPKDKINIVFLEGIHQNAVNHLAGLGYTSVEYHANALEDGDLIHAIRQAHIVGIRSRTKLHRGVLQHAENLFAIGCFCIGTNQVDLESACSMGIPVFNAPYSNTRSVAELALGSIIMLARRIPEKTGMPIKGYGGKRSRVPAKCAAKHWELSAMDILELNCLSLLRAWECA